MGAPIAERRPLPRPNTSVKRVEERRLMKRYREHGDLAARDELTRRLMPLARQLAGRYRNGKEPFEDLVQVANMGLVKAIERFDPDRGTTLSTYAVPTIMGELRRYFRDSTWSVHVGRRLQEHVLLIERVSTALSARLGRTPSVGELAKVVHLSQEEIVEALQASSASRATSLDAALQEDDADSGTLADTLGSEEGGFELIEEFAAMDAGMRNLDARSREILRLRFQADMTQTEIANELGVSQMHVSRLLRRALATLRESAAIDVPA
jgi:RNA polymerase sigma-B factor